MYVHGYKKNLLNKSSIAEAAGIVRKQPHGEETPRKNTVEKHSDNNLESLRYRES